MSQGKLLSIANYYERMNGLLTPVRLEGLRLLLTPSPQGVERSLVGRHDLREVLGDA